MQLYKLISNFFFKPMAVFPLGIFRIFYGLIFLYYIITAIPVYQIYYSDYGYLTGSSPSEVTTWETAWSFNNWPSLYYYLSEDQLPLNSMLIFLVLATVLFTLGIWTNLAAFLMYMLWYSIALRNGLAHNGEDGLMRFALFYAIFIPYGHSLSLRNYLRRSRGLVCSDSFVPFVLRLFQINVVLVYMFSLPYKIVDDYAWVDGTALYYTVLNTRWGLSPDGIGVLTSFGGILIPVLTYWTLFCEGFFVLFVWFKRTRLLACLLLGQLHVGIAFSLINTMWFNIAALLNVMVFLRREDYLFFLNIGGSFIRFLKGLLQDIQSYFKTIKNFP